MFPLYDENPRTTRPYVNYALIAINFMVFIWEVIVTRLFTDQRATIALFMNHGFVPARFLEDVGSAQFVDAGISILSSMFMHGSIMHILGNMLFLWIFGDNVEDRFGHMKYLACYLFWGFAAAIAHLAWAMSVGGEQMLIPAVGASGAISGVLGAYMLMFPHARVVTLIFFFLITTTRIPAFAYLLLWFIYQAIAAALDAGGGVAYLAHIGGFVAGLAFGFAYRHMVRITAGMRARIPSIGHPGSDERYYPREQMLRPLRIEGIVTNRYVELLAEMPGVDERTISISVTDNSVVSIDAATEDGYRRYSGKAILRAAVNEQPESIQYLNGILRVRFTRI
ncbi:MAG: rhomboid family intramembrane serine protease [Candidatus Nitrosocaldus sp.]|nr:rhomboid family intramembrane serine protease [Candidatus Nitrosocaldus sp.]MDW7999781.1 rhomboid family intramembrane serine protease [Candidatus Nitrosocaldus sp.]